jgi:hypothetical protein
MNGVPGTGALDGGYSTVVHPAGRVVDDSGMEVGSLLHLCGQVITYNLQSPSRRVLRTFRS